jgi:hypothetical protein
MEKKQLLQRLYVEQLLEWIYVSSMMICEGQILA